MEKITQTLTLDLVEIQHNVVNARQGDRLVRELDITITNNGNTYSIPADAKTRLRGHRPDGKYVFYDTEIKDSKKGLIHVDIPDFLLSSSGRAKLDVSIYQDISGNETEIASTESFILYIPPNIFSEDEVVNSDNGSVLSKLIKEAQNEIDEMNQLEAEVSENESNRVIAEDVRKSNETARQNAETDRVKAEASRVAAENNRVTGENTRISNENRRQKDTAEAIKSAQNAAKNANEAAAAFDGTILDLKSHTDNTTVHIASTERSDWNNKVGKNGDSTINGSLTTTGTLKSGTGSSNGVSAGDKISMWTDDEGGNLRLRSPDKYGIYFEMDACDGNLRIYKGYGSSLTFPFTINKDTGKIDIPFGVNGNASSATRIEGFKSKSSSQLWGNQTGTFITGFADETDGAIAWRRDNPNKGQLSQILDGYYYQNEGKYRCMDESDIYTGTALSISWNGVSDAGTVPRAYGPLTVITLDVQVTVNKMTLNDDYRIGTLLTENARPKHRGFFKTFFTQNGIRTTLRVLQSGDMYVTPLNGDIYSGDYIRTELIFTNVSAWV